MVLELRRFDLLHECDAMRCDKCDFLHTVTTSCAVVCIVFVLYSALLHASRRVLFDIDSHFFNSLIATFIELVDELENV